MPMKDYVCIKAFNQQGIGGRFSIKYGETVKSNGEKLYYKDKPVCMVRSENAYTYFAIDEDNQGKDRGKLISQIKTRLAKRDSKYQARWDKLWNDFSANLLRRQDYDDFWIWDLPFYQTSIENLQRINKLISEV